MQKMLCEYRRSIHAVDDGKIYDGKLKKAKWNNNQFKIIEVCFYIN